VWHPGPRAPAGYGVAMSTGSRPRGRLPQRVYWVRRAIVLGAALLLVVGLAHLLGSGDSGSGGPSADVAAAKTRPTSSSAPPQGPVAVSSPSGRAHAKAPLLAAPDGPCDPADVTATPLPRTSHAGGPIGIVVALTSTRPACTFTVSPSSVALKISSGSDRIWSTQDCPRAVPRRDVVVRSAVPAKVVVTWSGRRSDPGCSRSTTWAEPGYYHAVAAVLGSEPSDVQFALVLPPRPVVTRTAHPRPARHASAPAAGTSPTGSPTATPTGKVD
jgi:hypothetical protein